MRFVALVLLACGLSATLCAQPVAPSETLGVEPSIYQALNRYVAGPPSLDSVAPVSALQTRAELPDDAEVAAWGAMLAGSVSAAAIGWYVVGAGLRLDAESDGEQALRTVMLSLGAPLAVAATAGAGYAGYRVVVALR